MITVDKLLLKIVDTQAPTLEELVSKQDSKVLRSLATSVSTNFFITENQSRLLMKILRENSKNLPEFSEEIDKAIDHAMWSRHFRKIEQVKKIFINKNSDGEPYLYIEFTFNSQIRKEIQNLTRNVENLVQVSPGKLYQADLTEKNIVTLIEGLKSFNFELSDEVKNHYETIKSWSKPEILDQFLITNITHQNFQKHITADLGVDTQLDTNVLKDRSVRYQYFLENTEKTENSLVQLLAFRNQPRTWVDKKSVSLEEVFSSLIELKRFPVLVVFDNTTDEKNLKNLEILQESLKNVGITENVAVYFRLQNSETGKKFNQIIAENKYNARLDQDTKVVCIQSGKIPKFFIGNTWKPMSVLVLDSSMGLRHGKTAVYSSCCDLIVEYADEPALRDTFIR